MSQVTIYLDEAFLEKVKTQAQRSELSVSMWIRSQLEQVLEPQWPDNYFDVFGSLASDDKFERPAQPALEDDCEREPL